MCIRDRVSFTAELTGKRTVALNFDIVEGKLVVSPFISKYQLYINIDSWNVVARGICHSENVIVTNIKYILESLGVETTKDELLVGIERWLTSNEEFFDYLEGFYVERGSGSMIARHINAFADKESLSAVGNVFYKHVSAFTALVDVLMSPLHSPLAEADKRQALIKINNLLTFERSFENKNHAGKFAAESIAAYLYKLLRLVGKDYTMIYLKLSPTLVDKFLKSVNMESLENYSDVRDAVKDFAYNHPLISIKQDEIGLKSITESIVDLGNIFNRLNKEG